MNLIKTVAATWLRIPEQGVDIISIVLAGAGINVLTAAPDNHHAVIVFLSGLAITLAGVLVIIAKYRARTIWLSVESNLKADQDALEKFLESGAKSTKPTSKSSSAHLEETIADFMKHTVNAASIGGYVLLAATLAIAGTLAAFRPVVWPDPPEEAVEKSLKSLKAEVVRVASGLEMRAAAIELQLVQANQAQTNLVTSLENLNKHIEKEIEQFRSDVRELAKALKEKKPAPAGEMK